MMTGVADILCQLTRLTFPIPLFGVIGSRLRVKYNQPAIRNLVMTSNVMKRQ
jgi:hypothetical protein